MNDEQTKIARLIRKLGAASEVELQAETLKSLEELRRDLATLEKSGVIRRRSGVFKGGYGDALELTPQGQKSVN